MDSTNQNGVDVSEAASTIVMDEESESKFRGWTPFRISVEPLFFSVMFIVMFSGGVHIDLLHRNACNVLLNRSDYDCNIENNSTLKLLLNSQTAQINMIMSLVSTISPLLLSAFIGPWSDNNGRKPFMILGFAGYMITNFLYSVMSIFPRLNPYFFILTALPQCFSGGIIALYICSYCYLSDIFQPQERTFRFNIFWSSCLLGGMVSNSSVATIFNLAGEYGYFTVFLINFMMSVINFIYAAFFLPETISKKEGKRCIFDAKYYLGTLELIFRGPLRNFMIRLFCSSILFSFGLVLAGEYNIEYLVGKIQFSWTLGDFNLYSIVTTAISVVSTSAGSLLMKKLKFENWSIILFCGIVMLFSELVRTVSEDETNFWISSCFMRFYSIIGPTVNAEMSSHVSAVDMGKLYSYTALIDSAAAFLCSPIYTKFYQSLVHKNLTLYTFYLSAVLAAVISVSALLIRLIGKKDDRGSTTECTYS